MLAFTDLHLHLLPEVDDGPRSVAESIELAREMTTAGVRKCTVTPHFNAWNPNALTNVDQVAEAVANLSQVLGDEDIGLEILSGAEHFLTPELIVEIEKGRAPLLGPGPYILVELPFGNKPLYAEELLKQLSLAGLKPVLAHPARYAWVQSDPDALRPVVELGVSLQATAGSLSGQYGPRVQKTAEYILRRGWYALPGSDIHHPGQRRSLAAMYKSVVLMGDLTIADILFIQNPGRVFTGEPLLPLPPIVEEPSAQRRFRLFG